MTHDPYCGHCGYSLKGLTESSRCPECGRPLVDVLQRRTAVRQGKRYKSSLTIFGLPLVHVAIGPHEDERYGKARGIIAIGDVATGWFAVGGVAFGLIALGGLSIGLVALGGLAAGLVTVGGMSVGGLATGGGAIGGVAVGGGAVGYVAEGGGAAGVYVRGGGAYGRHVITAVQRDPEAVAFFDRYAWFFGSRVGMGMNVVALWQLVIAIGIASILFLLVGMGYLAAKKDRMEGDFR